jgi:hypothetical protein
MVAGIRMLAADATDSRNSRNSFKERPAPKRRPGQSDPSKRRSISHPPLRCMKIRRRCPSVKTCPRPRGHSSSRARRLACRFACTRSQCSPRDKRKPAVSSGFPMERTGIEPVPPACKAGGHLWPKRGLIRLSTYQSACQTMPWGETPTPSGGRRSSSRRASTRASNEPCSSRTTSPLVAGPAPTSVRSRTTSSARSLRGATPKQASS